MGEVTNERVSFVIRMMRPDDTGFEQGLDAEQIIARYGKEVGRE